jgi:hypothetical protein
MKVTSNKIYLRKLGFMLIFALCALTSCTIEKQIFKRNLFDDLDQLKISEVIKIETNKGSKDITQDHLIEISKGIYPNKKGFILCTPKIYESVEKPNFKLETEYFYSKTDSTVKVILYEWNFLEKERSDFSKENAGNKKKYDAFQVKFNSLSSETTNKLGRPIEVNINQNNDTGNTYRDDITWSSRKGINAYLFMFVNKRSGYRQIRLAIYKD